MAFNGSGTFLINTAGQPVVSGTVISSTAFNALTADLATGLSTAITKDGQTTVTANIPMSTYKFTGLGVGSAATDSANLSQVQSTVTKLLNSVSGADTITATASPTLAAYAAGQMFYFVAAGDNTTSVTLNIDSLGAKAVTRDGSVALAAADIKSGEVIVVVYDGTRFQVVSQLNSAGDARFANVSIASSLYVGGVSTFVGNAGFSANVSIASALSVGGVAAITGATTIGGNLTLSGGTANGVLYLNGSKVATSGSALTFDGTNFATTGNANLGSGSKSTDTQLNFASDLGTQRIYLDRGTRSLVFYDATSTIENYRIAGITGIQTWGVGGSEQMRLTSTGLGIGTASPASQLDVTKTGDAVFSLTSSGVQRYQLIARSSGNFEIYDQSAAASRVTMTQSGNLGLGVTPSAWASFYKGFDLSTYSAVYGASTNNAGLTNNGYFNGTNWIYKNTAAATNYQQSGGGHSWSTAPSGTAGNAISFTQAMTLDASGNLGVGTTSPTYKMAVESTGQILLSLNSTNANGGYMALLKSGLATGYFGAANPLTSGSSTDLAVRAENALVFAAGGATERARITSGGDLLVGRTTTLNSNRFLVSADDTVAGINVGNGTGEAYRFYSNTTAVGTITVTGSATAYNTTSDYRLKDNQQPLVGSGAFIDALKPKTWNWKADGTKGVGFIAHEVQEVSLASVTGEKDAVDEDGNPVMQAMEYGSAEFIANIVAELQSLRARITALESK